MIKQAIIPLAGLGTRLLPLTSVFAKELLPINGRPGIEYILDECIDAGIKEIVFIISTKKIIDKVDIFLVPGLGFDKKGTRLGKGSGIYDQLLTNHLNSTFIGITDKNHIVNKIPSESHDIQMHILITHDEIFEVDL